MLKDYKADCTYESIIKEIIPKGSIVLGNAGNKRTVQCCIAGLDLKPV